MTFSAPDTAVTLPRIIDSAHSVADLAPDLAAAGVRTVMRYYNHRNSSALPSKRLNATEARRVAEAGMTLGTVFQQRGGARGHIGDLDAAHGLRDGARAATLAREIGQPEGSAIYFAVDHDYWRAGEIASIEAYFSALRGELGRSWRIGVYGSGRVGAAMVALGVADLVWLAGATGWSGTADMLERGGWALFQNALGRQAFGGALSFDGNVSPGEGVDFGQFVPLGATMTGPAGAAEAREALRVVAPSGLRLRRGPGTEWPIAASIGCGTRVSGLGRSGPWVDVDIDGDGSSDGFMHGAWLAPAAASFSPAPAKAPG